MLLSGKSASQRIERACETAFLSLCSSLRNSWAYPELTLFIERLLMHGFSLIGYDEVIGLSDSKAGDSRALHLGISFHLSFLFRMMVLAHRLMVHPMTILVLSHLVFRRAHHFEHRQTTRSDKADH